MVAIAAMMMAAAPAFADDWNHNQQNNSGSGVTVVDVSGQNSFDQYPFYDSGYYNQYPFYDTSYYNQYPFYNDGYYNQYPSYDNGYYNQYPSSNGVTVFDVSG